MGLPASSWHRGPQPCPPPCPPSLASRPNPTGNDGKSWNHIGKRLENMGKRWENHGRIIGKTMICQWKIHWKLPNLWYLKSSMNWKSHPIRGSQKLREIGDRETTETSWLRWFSLFFEYGELCLSCSTVVYISWICLLFFVLFLHILPATSTTTLRRLSRRISWTMCSMKRCTSCFVSIFCFLSSFCRLSIVFSDCLGKAGQSVMLQRMLAMCLFSGRSNVHGFKRAWSGLLKPITVILGFFTSGFVSASIHLS